MPKSDTVTSSGCFPGTKYVCFDLVFNLRVDKGHYISVEMTMWADGCSDYVPGCIQARRFFDAGINALAQNDNVGVSGNSYLCKSPYNSEL